MALQKHMGTHTHVRTPMIQELQRSIMYMFLLSHDAPVGLSPVVGRRGVVCVDQVGNRWESG